MELYEANRILRSVKSAMLADGLKLPPSAETDGLMMLLDKLDCDKYLAPKIKHAVSSGQGAAAYKRAYCLTAFFRALALIKKGINPPVTSVSMMLLNKTLFGDLDGEAGKPRNREATTEGNSHTDPKYIPGSIKSIVTKMNDIESSPIIGKDDFAGYLTHYMRELIILHPFECGCEFTLRVYLILFSKIKGFALCYYRASPAAIKAAENAAFLADDVTPLYKVLVDCLSYERTTLTKRTAPKTRREIGKENMQERQLSRAITDDKDKRAADAEESEAEEEIDEQQTQSANDEEIRAVKLKAQEQKRPTDADVLKRAIKLQQKISRLNEQLTELMSGVNEQPTNKPSGKNDGK